jgi:hypothetical protein
MIYIFTVNFKFIHCSTQVSLSEEFFNNAQVASVVDAAQVADMVQDAQVVDVVEDAQLHTLKNER